MISLAPGTKVYLACRPVDLRNGFDGLAAKAQQMIGADPFSGHLFIFRGKRGDYFKGLYWDGSGLWLIAKRLEKGALHLAADHRRRDDPDAGAILSADRGDGLAAHNSTTGAGPANADLTNHRFGFDSGPPDLGLVCLAMSLATADLPDDIAALRAFALACQGELKAAQLAVQVKALEIEKLRFQIAKLRRMQFGRSSERITRQIEQLELQLEELETGEAEDIARMEADERAGPIPQRTRPKRKPLPDHLPREEIVHQPEADSACTCPACGGSMGKLGEDVTEVLNYVPGHFQVIRHVRPKYACQACDVITQAPAPAMPTPHGRATPAMLAHLLVSKYCDHLPLYRQCEIYAREGLELERSTLCDWVGQAAWLLAPVVAAIRAHVFSADKIHGDDTTVPVLAPGLGRTKTGRLWVYVRDDRPFCGTAPPAAAYFYSPNRGAEHPAAHMAGFTGMLQADGYAGFEKLYGPARTKPGPIIEVACWAHTRRGFFDEWEHHKSPTAKQALDRIAAIYAVEARAGFAPLAERLELRRQTAPLVDEFFAWAEATTAKLSAKSSLAGAFRYAINRREALSRFISDGRLEVDNNIAENAMRGIAIGRKNYLFAGSDSGGERAAGIYTLVQTAKLNDMNPEAYLKDILAKIAEGHPINKINALLPWQAKSSS